MIKHTVFILSCAFLVCCQHNSMDNYGDLGKHFGAEDALIYEEAEIEPPRSAEPPLPEDMIEKGSKIIKRGNMKFEVKELDVAKYKIDLVLENCRGYYENEHYSSFGDRTTYSLQLRIPNSKFDSLIHVIEKGVGQLVSKNITADDVTEEYTDLNIRLNNNLAYLKQYKIILQKAKSVKEILEVQEKIRRIEEEIESKKGRINYLDDKVKYSTLNLEISELIISEIAGAPTFTRRLLNAFNNGAYGFLSLIVGLVSLWPLLILTFLLVIARKPILRKIGLISALPVK